MIKMNRDNITIENSFMRRKMVFTEDCGLMTESFINKTSGLDYCKPVKSCEFIIGINGKVHLGNRPTYVHPVNGNTISREKAFEFVSADSRKNGNMETLTITLNIINTGCSLELQYELIEGFAGMRKSMRIINGGNSQIHVKFLYFEAANCYPGELSDIEVFNEYGINKIDKTNYGDSTQAMLELHNATLGEGVIFSCDSPASIKRICTYMNWEDTAVLMGYNSDTVPFNKYIAAGTSYQTHSAYTFFYNAAKGSQKIRNNYTDFIRKYLPVYDKTESMYCTWIPFCKNINEKLILELADKAAGIGFDYFLIDDGWFEGPGWPVDTKKFPSGLKKLSESIREKGLKFGLWFNIGSEYGALPEYGKYNAMNGDTARCHGIIQNAKLMCLASGYREIVADKLVELATDFNVDYFKLDFTITRCVYGFASVGCTSIGHEYHKNWNDSVISMYESIKLH